MSYDVALSSALPVFDDDGAELVSNISVTYMQNAVVSCACFRLHPIAVQAGFLTEVRHQQLNNSSDIALSRALKRILRQYSYYARLVAHAYESLV